MTEPIDLARAIESLRSLTHLACDDLVQLVPNGVCQNCGGGQFGHYAKVVIAAIEAKDAALRQGLGFHGYCWGCGVSREAKWEDHGTDCPLAAALAATAAPSKGGQ